MNAIEIRKLRWMSRLEEEMLRDWIRKEYFCKKLVIPLKDKMKGIVRGCFYWG